MKNRDEAAFPGAKVAYHQPGLTKREHFALHIYANMAGFNASESHEAMERLRRKAITEADALLEALDETS